MSVNRLYYFLDIIFPNMIIHISGGAVKLNDCSYTDMNIVCHDGVIRTSKLILASLSTGLKSILLEAQADDISLVLPEVSVSDVTALMTLVTVGECVICDSSVDSLEDLRHRLGVNILVTKDKTVLHKECVGGQTFLCKFQCGASFEYKKRLKKHLKACSKRLTGVEIEAQQVSIRYLKQLSTQLRPMPKPTKRWHSVLSGGLLKVEGLFY